jgi:uncharacterized membrane protein YkvA (DUF1232 family)
MTYLTKIKEKAKNLKSDVFILYYLLKHKRTPLLAKILIFITIGYIASPVDLIPDFIPVLGYLDDLIIVPVLVFLSYKLIPKEIISEVRSFVKEDKSAVVKIGKFIAVIICIIWAIVLILLIRFIFQKIQNENVKRN